jgi:hypothetical protein
MVNGVSDKVLELQDEIREYILEAVSNNELTELEYNALLELLIADLENAPVFEEL